MAGLEAIVTKILKPMVTVAVLGESWKAVFLDGDIEVDETVEILAVDHFLLKVRRSTAAGSNETR
jgi:membrane-bound ClpP family serine protease